MKDSADREDVDISAAGARQSASYRAVHHGERKRPIYTPDMPLQAGIHFRALELKFDPRP